MKKLVALRRTFVETLFQPETGTIYAHQSDGFFATFLPGRNVVVVEATTLDGLQTIKKVCQPADFHTTITKFPGRDVPGMMAIFGRGIEGFDAAGDIPGVVVEHIDRR